MPAAAVIPAPRVYTKVVAVKKLVVEYRGFNGHWWSFLLPIMVVRLDFATWVF